MQQLLSAIMHLQKLPDGGSSGSSKGGAAVAGAQLSHMTLLLQLVVEARGLLQPALAAGVTSGGGKGGLGADR